jgi:hypothetical protein
VTAARDLLTITLNLLVYRGVMASPEKDLEFVPFPISRYDPDPAPTPLLDEYHHDFEFFKISLRAAFRADYARGDLVQKTTEKTNRQGCHPWIVARGYRYFPRKTFSFKDFYPAADCYSYGGNQRLQVVFAYCIFCSCLLSVDAHYTWVTDVFVSGCNSSEKRFELVISPNLLLTYVQLDYIRRPVVSGSVPLADYDSMRQVAKLNLLPGVFPITLEEKSISDFPGGDSTARLWEFLDSGGAVRRRAIRDKLDAFTKSTPPHASENPIPCPFGKAALAASTDFSESVLEWIKARVFAPASPDAFFDRQLDWFFDESESLLVRQLYAVMDERAIGSGREWAIFTWLLDIWAGAPDLNGATCARFFWNAFSAKIITGGDRDVHVLIGDAARSALQTVSDSIPLRSCTPWSIRDGRVQFLRLIIDQKDVQMPLIERVAYTAAMFHRNGALGGPGEWPIDELPAFFSFLRALPRARFTRHLPAVSALAAHLRRVFASQPSLADALLRLCPTCADLLALKLYTPDPRDASGRPLPSFRTLWLRDVDDAEMAECTSAFEEIDRCCAHLPEPSRRDAYERLCTFSRFAVDAHNALLFNAPPAPVPFAVLERAHIFPHINAENTLVQVLVKEPHLPVDPLAIVGFLVQRLTEPASLWFGSGYDFPSKIRFDFDGEQTDVLGFTDAIFRDSLRAFLGSRPPGIRAALAAPTKLRDNVLRDAGIATALLLFQDIGAPMSRRSNCRLSCGSRRRCLSSWPRGGESGRPKRLNGSR